jgi:predicted CXXCH cytochrome family protein
VDVAYGGTFHNHPTGCTACHGNPTGDATSTDFPHTSKFGEFLKAYPDGLCISCHNGTTRLLP